MKRLLLFLALPLTACATVPAPAAGPTAGLGQTAAVGGVTVRPLRIVEDSRCPADAVCVWAGQLVLLVEVDYRGGSETFRGNMTLGQRLALGDVGITLIDAQPPKMAARQTPPGAYRFTFAVEPTP